MISDSEIAAAERVVPVVRLIEQIVTYRRPGAYQFAEDFPDESATWREVAAMFRQSPVKEVRNFGRAMADITRCLREVDEAEPSRVKRKVAHLHAASKAMIKAWERFCARMIAEGLDIDGV